MPNEVYQSVVSRSKAQSGPGLQKLDNVCNSNGQNCLALNLPKVLDQNTNVHAGSSAPNVQNKSKGSGEKSESFSNGGNLIWNQKSYPKLSKIRQSRHAKDKFPNGNCTSYFMQDGVLKGKWVMCDATSDGIKDIQVIKKLVVPKEYKICAEHSSRVCDRWPSWKNVNNLKIPVSFYRPDINKDVY